MPVMIPGMTPPLRPPEDLLVGALVGAFVCVSVGAPTILQVASSHRPHLPFHTSIIIG